jgi:thiamine-monophosphate kinase
VNATTGTSRPAGPAAAPASEEEFLALVDAHFPGSHGHMVLGRGDDAAVVDMPPEVCVSTDLFTEDVHFRRAYFTPEETGYKALAVNISDIHGMGAQPLGFVCSLTLARPVEHAYWDRVLAGMAELAGGYDLPLVGGDLSRGEKTGFCITIWGGAPKGGRLISRGGPAPGEVLFSVGALGLARAGLELLEESGRRAEKTAPEAVAAHVRPGLHPEAAARISRTPGVTGLMDVSDGLARDLPRLLGPGLSADLDPPDPHPALARHAAERGRDPVELMILGGEDYALLGAADADTVEALAREVPGLARLGRIRQGGPVTCRGRELAAGGFDHFQG